MTKLQVEMCRSLQTGKVLFRSCLAALKICQPGSLLSFKAEGGKSLPATLITLAVGSLLLTPFLSFVSSRSLGARSAESVIAAQYAADAGIEFGIWSLLNTSAFRSQVDNNLGAPQPLSFPGGINGYTPTLSVTGLPIGTWTVRQSTPVTVGRGGAMAYAGGDRIYAIEGNNTRNFGYYSITADRWFGLANTPQNVRQGGALVYGGGNYLYAFQGRNTDSFWRYNISTNSWNSMEDAPGRVRQGGDLVWTGGNTIFAFRGNSDEFWRYNISADSWSSRADAPGSVGFGSDLAYTGGNNIYAFRGSNREDFWRYNISSNSWSSREDAPARVSNGGGLAYHSGGYIYALRGNSNTFWRYTIATDSWSTLTNAPANLGQGGDLIFTQATIGFTLRGGNRTDFWEFEVTPPRYDIHADAGSAATDIRFEIDGINSSVLFWDIE